MVKYNSLNRYSEQFASGLEGEGQTNADGLTMISYTDQNGTTGIGCLNRNNTVAETATEARISCHSKLNSNDALTEAGITLGNDLTTTLNNLGADAQNRLCVFGNTQVNGITFRNVKASTNFIWKIASTEVLRLDSSGLSFDSGTNHLNDYVEGTFTPDVGGSSSDPTTGWTRAAGYYTRVGSLVYINIALVGDGSTYTGGSGRLQVKTLPYTIPSAATAENLGFSFEYSNLDINNSAIQVGAVGIQNSAVIELQEQFDNASQQACLVGDLGTSGRIFISGVYFTS